MVILMVVKEAKKAVEKKVKEIKAEKKEVKVEVKKEVKPKAKENQGKAEPKVLAPTKESKVKVEKKVDVKKDIKKEITVEPKKEPAPIKAKEKQDKVADKATSKTPTKAVRKTKSASKKVKKKYVLVKAKRKTAIATARISEGKGRITINKKPIAVIDNKHLYNLVREPLLLTNNFKNGLINGVDIEIVVRGGGFMSQIIASRGCISKGLVEYYKDDKLKEMFMKYDKSLLVDDARRKETKKQLGTGARAKKQRSKR